ncbi:SDR family oxidoreductase [Actinomadura sp. 3N407]|uniref:SDR family NAD(P)-dependent oxidoreductase n=1 Tax=Actinomadura sp. 3N407 TaxID=3457423 RepID=UPI003FCD8200
MNDKVAVVMGAGSIADGWSNGKAAAVSYAREGAAVVCADYRLDRAEQTRDIIHGEGGKAIAVQADATSEAAVRSVVDAARTSFGRLDVMHNNVGIGGSIGTPDVIRPEDWDREIAQNLTTAYLGIRCAVPMMREQGGGAIVNISSIGAVRFLRKPNVGYTAAKAAVEAMTRACATAYGRDGIRVNCVRVGFSETPLLRVGAESRGLSAERMEAEWAKSRAKVPLRNEHADPFDIAAAATFLASDEAGHVTGVPVIGGRPPDLLDPTRGCAFSPRCPYVQERCRAEAPPLRQDGGDRPQLFACFYPLGSPENAAALEANLSKDLPQAVASTRVARPTP